MIEDEYFLENTVVSEFEVRTINEIAAFTKSRKRGDIRS